MAHSPSAQRMTLGQLLPKTFGDKDAALVVGPLCLDSRKITAGETFVALSGAQQDGTKFVDSAIGSGAALVLIEGEVAAVDSSQSVPRVTVPALRNRLSGMASRWFGGPSESVAMVGITGTNGKD